MVSDRRFPCVFNDCRPRGQGESMRDSRPCQANLARRLVPSVPARWASELTGRNTARFSPSAVRVVHRADLTRMLRKSLMVFLFLATVGATLRLTLLPQFPEMPYG